MRILVTGAAGYIGGRIVDVLCQKDWVETVVGTAPGCFTALLDCNK